MIGGKADAALPFLPLWGEQPVRVSEFIVPVAR
jgi:hypothetical protein